MGEYITLIGAEQVQSAASRISAAADQMNRAAGSMHEAVDGMRRALETHQDVLRDFAEKMLTHNGVEVAKAARIAQLIEARDHVYMSDGSAAALESIRNELTELGWPGAKEERAG